MVRLRLRQWLRATAGPEDWRLVFTAPIDSLWQHVRTRAARSGPAGLPRVAPTADHGAAT